MSKDAPITEADRWFRGEAKLFKFDIVDGAEAPLDVSGFAMRWVLEDLTPGGVGVDVLDKATGGSGITVENGVGTLDRVVVTINAADTLSLDAAVYRHALWRTDAGSEALLLDGAAMLQAASAKDA